MDERARVARDRAEGVSVMRGLLYGVPVSLALVVSAVWVGVAVVAVFR